MLMVRTAGSSNHLHASDARYHNNCLSRFFSQWNAPGESNGTHDEDQEETLQSTEMRTDLTNIWDSVGLQEQFKRADLLKMLSLAVDDIFILSAPGYRKVVRFRDNARATLKVKRDDAEEDDIDDALDMIARVIKAEISMYVATESVSRTLQLLLHKLFHSFNADSLTSLLIGNMVTSVLDHHATSL